MASVADILSMFGLSGDIAKAVIEAEADPTSRNINKVISAYASIGQTPPVKLIGQLAEYNKTAHPEDVWTSAVISTGLQWLAIGLIGLFILFRKKRSV
jgi:hypothetical protein